MYLPEVCVCYLLRPRSDGQPGEEVLLGRKKSGLGEGNLVGPGGKLEAGESALEAIIREVAEETSIVAEEPELVGQLDYPFPFKPAWSQRSWVFLCRRWSGAAQESDELSPAWFPVDQIPVGRMWDDARYWLPALLAVSAESESERRPAKAILRATFEFGSDLSTVITSNYPGFVPRAKQ